MNTNEMHVSTCRIAHQRLHSPVQLKLKSAKAEQMGDDSGKSPWDTKGQDFFRSSMSRRAATEVTKTLKGFSIQCEELFSKLSPDSCDGSSRSRMLLPISHVFRSLFVELLINWCGKKITKEHSEEAGLTYCPPPGLFSPLLPRSVPSIWLAVLAPLEKSKACMASLHQEGTWILLALDVKTA